MDENIIRILYVDDEKANLTNFKFLFQEEYEVSTALSANQGMELLQSEQFQIIISDQRMPDKTGIEFLAQVSQIYPQTIRIILTAFTETQDILDAINIGQVYQYITKPFQESTVRDILKKASDVWRITKQNQDLISQLKEKNEEYEQMNEELRQANEELYNAKEKAEKSEQITKQLFIELTLAKEKAEENNRLKTAFLQNMSHEIKTPMNAIIGFCGLLEDEDSTVDKRNSFVSIIINSAKQLLSIVSDILTISSLETKQEKLNISKVIINNIIIELLAVFKAQAFNQNISLYAKQQLTDLQTEIYSDKTKVTQILTNLLTNALKFTHEGHIEFGYTLEGQPNESVLKFYVKDTGIGIKPEMQEKIFERFRQADISITKNYGGTGLGLSISKGFIDLMNGKIWVESEEGKGSTFYFTIPYNPVHESNTLHSTSILPENISTILVAEDEEYNYLLIEVLLKKMNVNLIHAKDGKEAVEICSKNPTINLILMDIKMPIIDGHTAAKMIKETRPNLPIIAQSAYALEHELERYNGNAFDDYITKPINKIELKEKILKYIKM